MKNSFKDQSECYDNQVKQINLWDGVRLFLSQAGKFNYTFIENKFILCEN